MSLVAGISLPIIRSSRILADGLHISVKPIFQHLCLLIFELIRRQAVRFDKSSSHGRPDGGLLVKVIDLILFSSSALLYVADFLSLV